MATTSKKETVDLVIIGAGPGGYPAAIKAASNGLSVALVEPNEVGGTCLNRGCIPSKALIASARNYHLCKTLYPTLLPLDYEVMQKRADEVVLQLRKSLESLLKSHGVSLIRGSASFLSHNEVKVVGEEPTLLSAKNIIIASGSLPRFIPAFPTDGKRIIDSTQLLQQKTLPKSLLVIGGGVIGCEFASLYNLLGVEVTLVEMLPRLLTTECEAVVKVVTEAFQERGIQIITGVPVGSVKSTAKGVLLTVDEKTLQAEQALVAVGRAVLTKDLALEKAGIQTDERGAIRVDSSLMTTARGVFAIGDVLGKWWLAHVATHQGLCVIDTILGRDSSHEQTVVPSVVFTDPEIASVGLTPEMAKEAVVGKYPFQALGKAQVISETRGFAQVVVDPKTGQILGAQVVGPDASTLIAEMTLAIANELTVECLVNTIHAHPTLSEVWVEAALLAMGTPLHFPPKKRSRK